MPSFFNMTSTNPVVIEYLADATHGSFKAGDPVFVHTTGKIRIGVAGSASIGIAQKDVSAADDKIPVELWNPNDIYVGTHAGTSNVAHNGDIFDFTASAGAFTVNTGGTTDFIQVGLYDSAGASGRIKLRILGGGKLDNANSQ